MHTQQRMRVAILGNEVSCTKYPAQVSSGSTGTQGRLGGVHALRWAPQGHTQRSRHPTSEHVKALPLVSPAPRSVLPCEPCMGTHPGTPEPWLKPRPARTETR